MRTANDWIIALGCALVVYEEADRPLGGEVRVHTTDSAAVAAVHAFLTFQRTAHHAAAHEVP